MVVPAFLSNVPHKIQLSWHLITIFLSGTWDLWPDCLKIVKHAVREFTRMRIQQHDNTT